MQECVRLDSGETYAWIGVNRSLRRDYVTAAGLFLIFFAAVLTVTFGRFSIDEEEAKDCIRIGANSDKTKE